MSLIKLNLGAGVANKKGWICVDKYVNEEKIKRQIELAPDSDAHWEKGGEYIQADIKDMPFPDNYADHVEAHQVLEHVGFRNVIPSLKEIYRVMKPGAKLILDVPSMNGLVVDWMDMILHNSDTNTFDMDYYTRVMETIYGNQVGDGEFHSVAFTVPFLNVCLVAAGFKNGEFAVYAKNAPTPQIGEWGSPQGHLKHEIIVAEVTK